MKLPFNGLIIISLLSAIVLLNENVFATAPYRVNSTYEDTVRIMLVWNDAQGLACNDPSTTPVGKKTLDFIVKAIDTSKINNVKMLVNSTAKLVTWENIVSLWGTKLPHVIVHINAGWSSGWNGKELDTIFGKAVQNKIGIVSVGDDAASLASETFGFRDVDNVPAPLNDATSIDSLWIGLIRANDNKLKKYVTNNVLEYPGVNGIVSNAIDSITHREQFSFFPVGKGRCQADADRYGVLYPQWITMLGFQQGIINGTPSPGKNELNVLVAIQDTLSNNVIRRGVALSFQPQFLRDSIAVQQISYDAIMFASLTHTLSVASKIVIRVASDSVIAGQKISFDAELYDQHGNSIDSMLQYVRWSIVSADKNDIFTDSTGKTTQFTGTKAWRTVTVKAEFTDPKTHTTINTTASVFVKPGAPHHLDVSMDSTIAGVEFNNDADPITSKFDRNVTSDTLYSFIRDKFGNYVRKANPVTTTWQTSDNAIVKSNGAASKAWQGIVLRVGTGNAVVTVREDAYIPDQISIGVDAVAMLQRAYTRDIDGDGLIDRVEMRFDSAITIADVKKISDELAISHGSDKFIITKISSKSTCDSVFYVDVNELIDLGLQTDWSLTVKGIVSVRLKSNELTEVPVDGMTLDGIGAVVNKATYAISDQPEKGDTIRVVFSEPVSKNDLEQRLPKDVFLYYSENSAKDIALLEGARFIVNQNDEYVSSVTVVLSPFETKKFTIVPFKDMVQLVNGLDDKLGNTPPNKDIARKVLLEPSGTNNIKISIYPNPTDPMNNDLQKMLSQPTSDGTSLLSYYGEILDQYEAKFRVKSGILVALHSKKPLQEINNSFGTAMIYDALGNLIVKSLDLKRAYGSQEYALIWNGMSDKGRNVGAGTYLLFVKVKDIDGNTYRDKKRIGVKFGAVIGIHGK